MNGSSSVYQVMHDCITLERTLSDCFLLSVTKIEGTVSLTLTD